jgi:hypothetical protein
MTLHVHVSKRNSIHLADHGDDEQILGRCPRSYLESSQTFRTGVLVEEMTEPNRCQYCYEELVGVSVADAKSSASVLLQKYCWRAKGYAWYLIKLGPFSFMSNMLPRMGFWKRIIGTRANHSYSYSGTSAKLKAGDLVEVKSVTEILKTLDEHDKLKGLSFTPEMVKFAGRQFRVYKVLRRIILETNGQVREIRTPTVLLDGVVCDGSAHGSCDRSCFCFWREAWLSKIAPSTEGNEHSSVPETQFLRKKRRRS